MIKIALGGTNESQCCITCIADNAYAMDPRIKKHQEDLKLAKQREKEAKREAARKRAAEEERVSDREQYSRL